MAKVNSVVQHSLARMVVWMNTIHAHARGVHYPFAAKQNAHTLNQQFMFASHSLWLQQQKWNTFPHRMTHIYRILDMRYAVFECSQLTAFSLFAYIRCLRWIRPYVERFEFVNKRNVLFRMHRYNVLHISTKVFLWHSECVMSQIYGVCAKLFSIN